MLTDPSVVASTPGAGDALLARPVQDRRLMGAVYTPDVLARWVATLLRDHSDRPIHGVVDPACGDGALLAAADAELSGLTSLVGVDLSESAALAVRDTWPRRARTVVADALRLTSDDLPRVDAAILNPPWGADVGISRAELRILGYDLANGQYDSWDLFLEWTLRALPAGTTEAAILPDALFLPEHEAARRLLVDRTRMHVVARLGEGWFDGVFRGVAVVVYSTGVPVDGWIRCLRLPHDARRRILSGAADLASEATRVETRGRQSAWAADTTARFMPATSPRSVEHICLIESQGGPWTRWVSAGRGVEIGKSGALVRCGRCGRHRQPFRNGDTRCSSCGNSTSWADVTATSLRRPSDERQWVPLIVGEDVTRYRASASRWLRLGLDGVQYKDDAVYATPKLLVRKTGLGLNASRDTTGSFTTQVVYHYLARPEAPDFVLSYLEGLLCSRVLLALHLSRTGETEWRSHPYVTPKVLATLPIPTPRPGTDDWRQARAIGDAAADVRAAPLGERPAAEARVDRLVAGLFGLDDDGCAWVDSVLAQTQTLQAFAHFRSESSGRLRAEVAT